jgi:hypothetical protein
MMEPLMSVKDLRIKQDLLGSYILVMKERKRAHGCHGTC